MDKTESVELTAKSVEEAIELALKQLGAGRDEVEVDVVSRGRAGILGFGSEPARVRVSRLPGAARVAPAAIEVLSRLFSLMGTVALATIRSGGEGPDDPVLIDIQGDDSGLLIGRRGETLQSLQFLVSYMLSRRLEERVRVVLDVEQYRERRERSLSSLAMRMAERVAATGRTITLEPMPPADRRIVHVTLADHPQVQTQSVGVGEERKVSILVKRGT